MVTGKHMSAMIMHQTKTHELPLVGFLIDLFWMAGSNHQAHYRLNLIVKPFADIVSHYTCQNGDYKATHERHDETPPSCCQYRDGNKTIIPRDAT